MVEKGCVCFPVEDPYRQLIQYFTDEHLYERALEVVDHAITQFSYQIDFHLTKAELLLRCNQAADALVVLDKVAALAPGNLDMELMRAEALTMLGWKEEALALLENLKHNATSQELSQILVCEALLCERDHAYEHMFYLLKAALEANPMNIEALSRMWYCVEQAGKHRESVELHERILEEYPFSSLAWYNLGCAYEFLCEYEKSIEAYEFAFITNQDFEYAYRDCAEVCMYTGNYQKALQCLQEVVSRFEPDAELFVQVANCHLKLGNPKVARTFYLKAAQLDNCCAEAYYGVAQCHATQARWKAAADNYQRAILYDDQNEAYYEGLADACFAMGKYVIAEQNYRFAVDLAPESSHLWMKLAQFLIHTGRSVEALEVLEEAEDYCGTADLLFCRSACLFLLGRRKEALQVFADALIEDYHAHPCIFRWVPLLEHDPEIKAILATLKPAIGDEVEQVKRR